MFAASLTILLFVKNRFIIRQKCPQVKINFSFYPGTNDFNRAKLMNVGFVESQKLKKGGWQCFIFHDIDLLPLDTRNLYSCPRQPRHMSVAIDKLHFK